MYKKIIVIYPREFTKKEYVKSSLKYFKKKNIDIEIWIINNLIRANKGPNSHVSIDKKLISKNINYKIIKSNTHLKKLLYSYNDNKNILFDMRVKLNFNTLNFFKIFFFFNFNYLLFANLILIRNNLNGLLSQKFNNFIIKTNLFFSKVNLRPAKYIYSIGLKSDLINNLLISKKSQIIKGHHADYDRFLELKKKNVINKYQFKYFVFLDQDAPAHLDLINLNENDVDESNYYNSLLKFFLKLEDKFNFKYIVSPHPRANFTILKKYFGSRLSTKPTINLIKDSEFVLSHDSTATNYAFLFNKPVISIINDELINSIHDHKLHIHHFCERAKLKTYDISKDQIKKSDLIIDKKKYKIFIKNYIKNNNNDDNRVNIICKNIDK